MREYPSAKKVFGSLLPMRRGHVEIEVASSPGTHFPSQESHEGQPCPLAKAEWLRQLLLGVLKGGMDCILSGNLQASTSVP